MNKYKTDTNHAELRDYMRKLGAIVKDTSMFGNGFPDLLVKYRGRIYYIEIKKSEKEKLTKAEEEFRSFIGEKNYSIVVTRKDVYKLFGELDESQRV